MSEDPDINSIINTEFQNALTGKETAVDNLKVLLNLTPQELTDTLMSNYPIKDVIPPTTEELEAANMEIPTPEYLESEIDKETFKDGVSALQGVLKRNRIVDVFPNQKERAEYEATLADVLKTLDNLNDQQAVEKVYSETWGLAWNNNKYTRNSLNNIHTGLLLLTMLPLPAEELDQIQKDMQTIQYVSNPQEAEKDKSKTDEDIKPAVDIAINTLRRFSK